MPRWAGRPGLNTSTAHFRTVLDHPCSIKPVSGHQLFASLPQKSKTLHSCRSVTPSHHTSYLHPLETRCSCSASETSYYLTTACGEVTRHFTYLGRAWVVHPPVLGADLKNGNLYTEMVEMEPVLQTQDERSRQTCAYNLLSVMPRPTTTPRSFTSIAISSPCREGHLLSSTMPRKLSQRVYELSCSRDQWQHYCGHSLGLSV